MTWVGWAVTVGVVVVLGGLFLAWQVSERGRRATVRSAARAHDLAVPEGRLWAEVSSILTGREVAGAVGAVIGVAVALAVPLTGAAALLPEWLADNTTPLWLGGLFLGIAGGSAAHAVGHARASLPEGSPRVARGREVGPADFVRDGERRAAVVAGMLPGAVVVLTGALVLAGVTDPGGLSWPALLLAAVVPVLLLLLALAACRTVLRHRRPVPDVERLAWDDVVRSKALRDVLAVPTYAGSVTGFVLLVTLVEATLDGYLAAGATGALALLLVVGLVLSAALSLADRPGRQLRARLWGPAVPTPAAQGDGPTGTAPR
jgi:hypothetical protein